jgi:hypothetical protein
MAAKRKTALSQLGDGFRTAHTDVRRGPPRREQWPPDVVRGGVAAVATTLRQDGDDADRARLPPLPLQRAGGPGRSARRAGRARAGRWRLAAPGHRPGPAVLDAPMAAAGAGRAPGHLCQPAVPRAWRIRARRARRQPRPRRRRRRAAAGGAALARVARAARTAAGRARRFPARRRCTQGLVAGKRARRDLREVPGLAARLAAALGALHAA